MMQWYNDAMIHSKYDNHKLGHFTISISYNFFRFISFWIFVNICNGDFLVLSCLVGQGNILLPHLPSLLHKAISLQWCNQATHGHFLNWTNQKINRNYKQPIRRGWQCVSQNTKKFVNDTVDRRLAKNSNGQKGTGNHNNTPNNNSTTTSNSSKSTNTTSSVAKQLHFIHQIPTNNHTDFNLFPTLTEKTKTPMETTPMGKETKKEEETIATINNKEEETPKGANHKITPPLSCSQQPQQHPPHPPSFTNHQLCKTPL